MLSSTLKSQLEVCVGPFVLFPPSAFHDSTVIARAELGPAIVIIIYLNNIMFLFRTKSITLQS